MNLGNVVIPFIRGNWNSYTHRDIPENGIVVTRSWSRVRGV